MITVFFSFGSSSSDFALQAKSVMCWQSMRTLFICRRFYVVKRRAPGGLFALYIVSVRRLTFSKNMEFPDVEEKQVLNRSVLGNASPDLLEFFMCLIAINPLLMEWENLYYSNKEPIYRTTSIPFLFSNQISLSISYCDTTISFLYLWLKYVKIL